jgi:putative ABC transport system permease protein
MGEHVEVLVFALVALALMMGVVGAVALAAAMSTSVAERGRELAVLAAIGGRPRQVRALLVGEAWVVVGLSLPLTVLAALALSAWVGGVVGQLSFRLPLPLTLSWTALAVWSVGLVVLGGIASWVPAWRATRRPVVERLGEV